MKSSDKILGEWSSVFVALYGSFKMLRNAMAIDCRWIERDDRSRDSPFLVRLLWQVCIIPAANVSLTSEGQKAQVEDVLAHEVVATAGE
jgi:hypothetical protein